MRAISKLVLVLPLVAAACGPSPAEPTSTMQPEAGATEPSAALPTEAGVTGIETIKVAIVDDFSGPVAEAASDQDFSFIFAVDQQNAKGGILGRQIEVIQYDDANDPQKTVSFVRRAAAEDEAILILGGSSSSTTSANIPIAMELEIPYLIGAGAVVAFTDPENTWIYRVGPHNGDDAKALREFIELKGYTAPAIINSSHPYALDGGNAVEKELTGSGLPPVAHIVYESESPDVSAQAINVLSAEPDAVVLYALAADGGRVTETLRQVGYTGDIITPRIGLYDAFRDTAGEAAEGVFVFNTVDPAKAEAAEFFQEREKVYGPRPPTMYVALGKDMSLVFFEALKHPAVLEALDAGDIVAARSALRDGFETINRLEGIEGKPGGYFSYSPDKHHGLTGDWFSFLVIKDGEFESISQ